MDFLTPLPPSIIREAAKGEKIEDTETPPILSVFLDLPYPS